MSELNPQEMVDIITLDRIAEVLQLRNTADPDNARAEVIGDLYRVRNMLVHGPNMPQVTGPTARDVIDRALRLLTDLGELEMTSLGTANVRRIRSRATAGRVADILTRHAEEEDRLGQDDMSVRFPQRLPPVAERQRTTHGTVPVRRRDASRPTTPGGRAAPNPSPQTDATAEETGPPTYAIGPVGRHEEKAGRDLLGNSQASGREPTQGPGTHGHPANDRYDGRGRPF